MKYSDNIYIYPTDTVWGIGARIDKQELSKKVLRAKNIDSFRPFSIMFDNLKHLREYVDLPSHLTDEWLRVFFKMESTLLVPKKYFITDLGNWIIGDSEFVGLRCLERVEVQKVYEMAQGPFTTTSLNITSNPPITNDADAKEFYDSYCPKEVFVKREDGPMSGNASTIIMLSNNNEFKVIREGKYFKELKDHLGLLST
ncbi:MAG: L-threonylcarbamoyladenylate synthase [Bacteriovoracaceae bacterium]